MLQERNVQKVWKNGSTTVISLPKEWVEKQEKLTNRQLECVVLKYNDNEIRIKPYPENGE